MACQLDKAIELLSKTPAVKKHLQEILNNDKVTEDKFGKLVLRATGKPVEDVKIREFGEALAKLIRDTTKVKEDTNTQFALDQIRAGMLGYSPARFSGAKGIEIAPIIDPQVVVDKVSQDFAEQIANETLEDLDTIKTEKDKGDRLVAEVENAFEQINAARGSHFLLHELVHAGAIEYMYTNPNEVYTKRIENIYTYLYNNHKELGIPEGYWKTNVDEFLAEALTNPTMIKALMTIAPAKPVSRLANVYETILNNILQMIGLKGEELSNLFDILLDSNLKILEEVKKSSAEVPTKPVEGKTLEPEVSVKEEAKEAPVEAETPVKKEPVSAEAKLTDANIQAQSTETVLLAAAKQVQLDAYNNAPVAIQSVMRDNIDFILDTNGKAIDIACKV